MNDLERQLQAVRLAAPSEAIDRRLDAVFSHAADFSEGGARCPQRASEHQPEFSNQRVELARRGGVNALHLRSPESSRTHRRRVSLFALLAGLGATAVAAALILLATRPPAPVTRGPSASAVVYHLEPTGLMRQFLTESPARQRPLPKFTVQVGSPALPPSTAKPNPSS